MSTPRLSLAQIVASVEEKLFTDLTIPRYEDQQIVVRYRPLKQEEISVPGARIDKMKVPEAQARAGVKENAKLLVQASLGIYFRAEGSTWTLDESDASLWVPFNLETPQEEWLQFGDPHLAEALGVEEKSSTAVCRKLFKTDGDINSTVAQLIDFSGYGREQQEEELAGE